MSTKARKETVELLANRLGYTLENNRNVIFLIKDDKRIIKRSFRQAYHFLYMKEYREKKKNK